MRNKYITKRISQVKDLNETSFENKNKVIIFHRLPLLNHGKSVSYFKPINFYSSQKHFSSITNTRRTSKVKDINRGIIWLKNENYKIPKLILSQKDSSIKMPFSERNLSFAKRYNRIKLNNTFRFPYEYFYFNQFNKMIQTKEVNEILGLKKESSEMDMDINEQKKEESEIDKYIQKLGITSCLYNNDLKTFLVSKIDKSKRNNKFSQNKLQKSKINVFNKSLFIRKRNKIKLEKRNKNNKSFEKNNQIKNEEKLNDEEKKIVYGNRKIKLIQKKINKFDDIYKNLTKKMKHFYEKKKNEFEKFVQDEFPLKIE